MASVYDLKPKFQALLRPLLRGLRAIGFTPNGLTLLALAGSLAVAAVPWLSHGDPRAMWLYPAWLFVRMALNALDGMMARELAMQSRLGAILNETGDVLSDGALYLSLSLFGPPPAILVFTLGAILTEFCGLLAQTLGAGRTYHGPMGKSDRAFFVGALVLISLLWPRVTIYWFWFFLAAALLELVTCVNRLRPALRESGDGAKAAA